jgi:hypothetical protein
MRRAGLSGLRERYGAEELLGRTAEPASHRLFWVHASDGTFPPVRASADRRAADGTRRVQTDDRRLGQVISEDA